MTAWTSRGIGPLRKPSSWWAVCKPPESATSGVGPVVWGWFRWRWQARRYQWALEGRPVTCEYEWSVLSAAELDRAWEVAGRVWEREAEG